MQIGTKSLKAHINTKNATKKKKEKKKKINSIMVKEKNYLHHSTDPEATMDGVDADDSLVGVIHDLIEKPQVVCHHCKKA